MILIEQDAKRLLMERLDECLKVHADMLLSLIHISTVQRISDDMEKRSRRGA